MRIDDAQNQRQRVATKNLTRDLVPRARKSERKKAKNKRELGEKRARRWYTVDKKAVTSTLFVTTVPVSVVSYPSGKEFRLFPGEILFMLGTFRWPFTGELATLFITQKSGRVFSTAAMHSPPRMMSWWLRSFEHGS